MIYENQIAIFRGKHIRRTIHQNEWWFAVVDIIAILTESPDPGNYWRVLKNRLKKEGSDQTITSCNGLKMLAADGKMRQTDCANTETLFRIIQSIPSPKAEPFKRWLARVGYERVQEIEDPELATKRTRAFYKAQGRPEDWIEKCMRSIAIREELTDEWKQRGLKQEKDYAILTAEISKAAFGLTPSEYKEYKRLRRQDNLRDHMGDLELIFSMLGEASTTEIARNRDAQGFDQNKVAAKEGGKVAGDARKQLEQKSGRPVVTRGNFLSPISEKKKLR